MDSGAYFEFDTYSAASFNADDGSNLMLLLRPGIHTSTFLSAVLLSIMSCD